MPIAFRAEDIDQSIPERFRAVVAHTPHAVAVRTRSLELSFSRLDGWSDAIAADLLDRLGTGPEPIPFLLSQGPLAIAATLGILKAGKFYVPIDPSWGGPRATDLLGELNARIALTDAEFEPHLHGKGVKTIELSPEPLNAGRAVDVSIHPGQPAYVYFTSGSTGRPKGVIDCHRNVLHNVMRYTHALRIGSGDRLSLLQSCGFSGAVSSMFAALLNGASSCPVDMRAETPARLAQWLNDLAVTIYHSVPSLFRRIVSAGDVFPHVRVVRLEGDRSDRLDLELFRRHFTPPAILAVGLGATETGLVCQYFFDHDCELPAGVVPIGRAVTDMAFEIQGDDGRPVSSGVAGQIVVRSRFLATGYWNNAAATAHAFESGSNGSERAYRTGDLGRIDGDGRLEYLGRLDGRARVRGQWIEPADLEAALCAIPGVREAAITVVNRSDGDARLVAYYVPEQGARPAAPDLRRQLVRRLPAHMVPSRFVELERLPLNANGKIDRAVLPTPGGARPNLGPVVEPLSLVQLRICELWEELLDIAPIGITDDFFDLGGDSLSSVLMVDAVERLVGHSIAAAALLGEGEVTVERIASIALGEPAHNAIVPIRDAGTRPRFFFLHGDYFSDGIYCRELSRHLSPEQPFFVLPPCGTEGGTVPRSYEEMAERHLDAIRSIQPHGPYVIGGECNGGLVAYEIARRLEAAGEQVPLLMLFSSSAQNVRLARWARLLEVVGTALGWPAARRRRLFGRLNDLAINENARSTGELLRAILRKRARIAPELRVAARMRDEGRAASVEHAAQAVEGHRERLRALYQEIDRAYLPGRFDGRVTLIRGRDELPDLSLECRWWRAVAGNVEAIEVPGDMRTKLTRHVGELGGTVDRLLDETARRWRPADGTDDRRAAERADAKDLRQRTLAGIGWSGATQVLGQAFQFGFSVSLARLLTPVEFGLVGMIAVFTGFATSLADFGLGAAIIQKPSPSQEHLNTVFWLNVAVGTLLTLLFSATAPLIAGFYHEPRLTLLTAAMASTFLLGSLGVVQNALLSKSIDFRARFWIECIATIASGIVAVALALSGAGVWSLVWQSIVLFGTRLGMLWLKSSWRPSWSFDTSATRELLRFARHMAAFNTIIYWENNLEKMVIGRLIGSSPLGIYGLAERLMRTPSTAITATAGSVMFPSISLIQKDVGAVKRVYQRSNRLIAAVTFPAMIGLIVVAEPLILSLVGEQWRGAIGLLQLLCLAGLAQSVYNTASWIYLSNGRPDLLLRSGIYAFAARVGGVLIGLHWGVFGIVSGYVVGVYACVLYPTWSAAGRLVGLRMIDLMKNVAAPFLCSAAMGVTVWLVNHWLRGPHAQLMRVAVGVPTGITVYTLLIRLCWTQGWQDIQDLLRRSSSLARSP
jgi:amino acid adenylation domain-containing protein